MAEKWPGNCGYCNKTGSGSLDKFECPTCKRTGCSTCMPTLSVVMCDQCVEAKNQEQMFPER